MPTNTLPRRGERIQYRLSLRDAERHWHDGVVEYCWTARGPSDPAIHMKGGVTVYPALGDEWRRPLLADRTIWDA